jgi:SAM-dependent methyltransferase
MTVAAPAHSYDAVAADYDRLIRPRYEPIGALVVERLSLLAGPDELRAADVVELSAGTGALTHQLAPLVASYLATDISEPMMAIGRGCPAPACRAVSWRQADVESSGLPAGSADLVVSSLGQCQDTDTGLAEVLRVLRPDGRLVATTWGDSYSELALLQETRERLGLPPRPVTTAAELRSRLRRAGWAEVALEEVRLPIVHPSLESYLAYRGAFGPLPPGGPGTAQVRQAMAESTRQYADEAGRLHLDWQLLVLSARG